ncbi:hypothetical protein [Tenacibaculum haliotis]|uniref:hypothetical protein n=1 Tax=Tenacibaculum haliotis TaxID=1888914 RepID=UPI0021B053B9|nr:hypothetical protein [Tenacibaculum haliotis]MCT4697618.1 hypothetical protein [Tenacibaculum haliotis]
MSTYLRALDEYENENEDGKHRLIFAYFGLSIYFAQVLEETFSIMLWTDRIFKKKVKTNKEVNEIINAIENSRKTMGNFINEVKQSYTLTDKITEDLVNILDKRNYIVHKYFKIEIQKCYSELGRKEMLQFFGEFIDQTKKLDTELNNYYKKYTDRLGFTKEKIEELVNQMKTEELNREKYYS